MVWNLYWLDIGNDRIEVSRLNGLVRKVFIDDNFDELRVLVLDLVYGYFFNKYWMRFSKILNFLVVI